MSYFSLVNSGAGSAPAEPPGRVEISTALVASRFPPFYPEVTRRLAIECEAPETEHTQPRRKSSAT
jgi:hypothetical protein